MSKHFRHIDLDVVAQIGETSVSAVRQTAGRYNVPIIVHRKQSFVDADDLPLLLGALRPEPGVLSPDGDI